MRILSDTRGAAMIEATIMLPVFIIVLAAVLYFHRAYSAKLQSNVKARSCAWRYSVDGCQRSEMPKECNIEYVTDGYTAIGDVVSSDDFEDNVEASESRSTGDTARQGIAGANRIALAFLGLREGIVAQPTSDVQRPSLLGGGLRRIGSDYSVMCNEREMKFLEILKYSYCGVGDDKFPGCPLEN